VFMAFEDLNSPIPLISQEELPDLMAYSLLQNSVADLSPRQTPEGMNLWSELRYRYTGETNYPRWSEVMTVGEDSHTVVLYGVQGELPGGKAYSHSSLRCSCCLPDHKSFVDIHQEYHPCPAKDLVIGERSAVYRQLVGGDELGFFDDQSLRSLTVFLVNLIKRDPLAWPPSDRSDRILVDPLAIVFGVPKKRMRTAAEELANQKVVHLTGQDYPSISLAA
jgi:hypothetical protein